MNGIRITDSIHRKQFSTSLVNSATTAYIDSENTYNESFHSIYHPKICIQDPDGSFPLNLKRTDITEKYYPFEKKLLKNIIDDYIAYLIIRCPSFHAKLKPFKIPEHPGVKYHARSFGIDIYQFRMLQSGLSVVDSNISQTYSSCLFLFQGRNKLYQFNNIISAERPLFIAKHMRHVYFNKIEGVSPSHYFNFDISENELRLFNVLSLSLYCDSVNKDFDLREHNFYSKSSFGCEKLLSARIILPKEFQGKILNQSQWISRRNTIVNDIRHNRSKLASDAQLEEDIKRYASVSQNWQQEMDNDKYCVFILPECPPSQINIETIPKLNEGIIVELFVDQKEWKSPVNSRLAKRWSELIPGGVIPFDIDERKAKLQKAYQELAPLIKIHEEMKEKGVLY